MSILFRDITGNLKAAFACQLGCQYNIRSNWQMKRNENEGTVPPGTVLDGSVFEKRRCWNSWVFPCKCWECLWLYSGIWGYHGGIKNYVKTPWLLFTQKVASVKDFYTLVFIYVRIVFAKKQVLIEDKHDMFVVFLFRFSQPL